MERKNPWESIPQPEIVPATPDVEERKIPSFVDLFGDEDPEDVIEKQERIDSEKPPTIH